MKNERDVKKEIKKVLDDAGAWWYMVVPNGFSRSGVPDFLVCLRGQFVAVEAKFGGNKESARQSIELLEISGAGGVSMVVNEKNVGGLRDVLDQL